MPLRFFSSKNRPIHMGHYPVESLSRGTQIPSMVDVPVRTALAFRCEDNPESIINAMGDHQAMMDAIRDGLVNKRKAEIPANEDERSRHLKSFGYFSDASMVGIGPIPEEAHLSDPIVNPDVGRLREQLLIKQTRTKAAGIDAIVAELQDAMDAPPSSINGHNHAIIFLYEYPRDPDPDEPGAEWILGAQAHRACMRSSETAVVIANYIRLLGWDAKAHTGTASDVDLDRLAVAAGLTTIEDNQYIAPYIGSRFGLAAVTTNMELTEDKPLLPMASQSKWKSNGPAWWFGAGFSKNAFNREPFAKRRFVDGEHPFETLKRNQETTTYIDEARVARVPKRSDMFARAQYGDLGKAVPKGGRGSYVRKCAPGFSQRRVLGAFALLQDDDPEQVPHNHVNRRDPKNDAECIKAASYFLGADAIGLSRCPDWTWYSHDVAGQPINPSHDNAISMIIDQGFDTMEGASGDDWIAVAQSMRAYLRFSLLGGVIAKQIRNLGYEARAHTVVDGEVLQPPLLLLSGLGEVSRIGEVILNPFLGPRLKSGVVTTTLPIEHDLPIDFGLQTFCESCNKCARECPSGAITVGPKRMFNGYEIWKSDSQKCATYRITTLGGAMCGRCMKTCPWNLEGLFSERPFRWAAMNVPSTAKALAYLDDAVGNGSINPIKKWWWDIELEDDGAYRPTRHPVNHRELQRELKIKHEDQTLAVYPANLAPHPWPYPFPMDREAGIQAYKNMISAEEYKAKIAAEDFSSIHCYEADRESPVLQLVVSRVEKMSDSITRYEFSDPNGADLPTWTAGAHIDIAVSPEYLRQYSLCGNPEDRTRYEIAVLREDEGRGGSQLLHRLFDAGRRVFVSEPVNHFELIENEGASILLGGGIGVTPMIAMAHRLHKLSKPFSLHYSISSRSTAGFLDYLSNVPWTDSVFLHVSDEGGRADFSSILGSWKNEGTHIYYCGPERYITAISTAAKHAGYPESYRHLEYFAVPELPEYENYPFTLKLVRSGTEITVPPEKSAGDALIQHGIPVDIKCGDGLCGVCKCRYLSGQVEHRDFVLSQSERQTSMILCQSRSAEDDGVIELDL